MTLNINITISHAQLPGQATWATYNDLIQSELRTQKTVKDTILMANEKALGKIGQVKANLAEAKAEIIAEINALKALVAGGASQADILAGLDELITESALLANVSPSLPTEPPAQG